jgi:hypothetical protein
MRLKSGSRARPGERAKLYALLPPRRSTRIRYGRPAPILARSPAPRSAACRLREDAIPSREGTAIGDRIENCVDREDRSPGRHRERTRFDWHVRGTGGSDAQKQQRQHSQPDLRHNAPLVEQGGTLIEGTVQHSPVTNILFKSATLVALLQQESDMKHSAADRATGRPSGRAC